MAANESHVLTIWEVPGTTEEIAAILGDAADLARWWPSVGDVAVLAAIPPPPGPTFPHNVWRRGRAAG